ncbi:hypothetical protein J6590_070276 [Homalodisca vitripennis]|nr:hypothetical protein J6590_070276 [Homalodisca vitripennis]
MKRTSKRKRILLILSYSHWRGLSHLVEGELDDFSVTVLSMSGAKLKHIIREGHYLAKTLCSSDFVVIMGGTNDTLSGEPAQIIIHQAIKWTSFQQGRQAPRLQHSPAQIAHPTPSDLSLSSDIDSYETVLNSMCSPVPTCQQQPNEVSIVVRDSSSMESFNLLQHDFPPLPPSPR